MDPVTIEKLKVDSLGKDQRPVKYVIEYVTTCSIKQNEGEPPVALKQIELNEPGRYSWSGEDVDISIVHNDGFCKRSDSTQKFTLKMKQQKLDVCPLTLENENWYFINFQDPLITGVYVHFDTTGVLKQYVAYSGESLFK